jgi:phage-related holin
MYPAKILAGILAGFVTVFIDNLLPLFIVASVFELVDFVTGCIKSAVVAKRKKQKFAFESVKAWRTVYKYVFLLIGIVLAELLDQTIANEGRLRFANYFTGFACGVEFWSFLENAAVISDHPIFRFLRKFMKLKVEETTGLTIDGRVQQPRNEKGQFTKK